MSTTSHHSSLSGKVLPLCFPSCTCQITSCKFPGLVLALTSLAWSRDSRPKQEILDDLLEQARQVRSGQKAWGDLLSVHQARQHQENDSLDHKQQQEGENANEDVSFQQSFIVGTEFMCNFCQKQFCRKQSFERQFSRREPDGGKPVNSPWTTC